MARDSNNGSLYENYIESEKINSLWVFGYGSLCWKPGFEFDNVVIGHVKGFSRKFWQGNTTHRGTEGNPGRVATLIDDEDHNCVYGAAFAVSEMSAIPYLTKRECSLGGYDTRFCTFYPISGEPIKVLIYIATPENSLWLGDAPAHVIASQVVKTSGPSGHNAEYVLRLANFMREYFPDVEDVHLFELEFEIISRIRAKRMCLQTLMGSGDGCISLNKKLLVNSGRNRNGSQRHNGLRDEPARSNTSMFHYTDTVAGKSLRCVNI